VGERLPQLSPTTLGDLDAPCALLLIGETDMATEGPIMIVLEVEEILVLTTVIESFRIACDVADIPCPRVMKQRIADILVKMIAELEKYEETN